MTLPAGARIGGYRIERLLGEGGMGLVYEAVHEVLRRRTAIKVLRPEYSAEPDVVTRFTQEAQTVNLINHEHIVNVYDIGDGADGGVYFVMEYLDGKDLSDVQAGRALPLPLLVHIYGQIMRALLAAHAKHIVHRDLKPSNIFVTKRDRNPYFVKVLDFGIAKLRDGSSRTATREGMVLGTPNHMSPEQIQGKPIDHRSDIFTLGIMLYRAATGVQPFRAESFPSMVAEIVHGDPPPLGDAVQPSLARMIQKALRKPVEERYQSVAEMLLDLEAVRREAGLDDEALGNAIAELAGMPADEVGPLGGGKPATRGSLAESIPVFQGVPPEKAVVGAGAAAAGSAPGAAAAAGSAPDRRRMLIVGGGMVVVGAIVAVAVIVGTGGGAKKPAAAPAVAAVIDAAAVDEPVAGTAQASTYVALFGAGDRAAIRKRTEDELTAAIDAGGTRQATAVAALALIGSPRSAPLLYRALGGGPDVRVKAARALRELKLPEAAPKLRVAVEGSGDKVRVELAAAMAVLGDADADAILRAALADESTAPLAALALVEAGRGDDLRKQLADVYAATPRGRERWRHAAQGLARLGDAKARAALVEELAQSDPGRALGAAESLVQVGDDAGRGYLERVVADASYTRRPAAALALARIGGAGALDFVESGLRAGDLESRMIAIAVVARLGAPAARFLERVAALADGDPDARVRTVAQAALWVSET